MSCPDINPIREKDFEINFLTKSEGKNSYIIPDRIPSHLTEVLKIQTKAIEEDIDSEKSKNWFPLSLLIDNKPEKVMVNIKQIAKKLGIQPEFFKESNNKEIVEKIKERILEKINLESQLTQEALKEKISKEGAQVTVQEVTPLSLSQRDPIDYLKNSLSEINEDFINYLTNRQSEIPNLISYIYSIKDNELTLNNLSSLIHVLSLYSEFENPRKTKNIDLLFENKKSISYFIDDENLRKHFLYNVKDPEDRLLFIQWYNFLKDNPEILSLYNKEKISKLSEVELAIEFVSLVYPLVNSRDYFHYLKEKAKNNESDQLMPFLITSKKEVVDFLYNLKIEEATPEIAKNYVVRKEKFAVLYLNADQYVYGNKMHQAVKRASACLKKFDWTFKELVQFHALQRRGIGYGITREWREIGRLRNTEMMTYCQGQYSDLGKEYLKLFFSIQEGGEIPKGIEIIEEKGNKYLLFVADIKGNKISLSKVSIRKEKKKLLKKQELKRYQAPIVYHTGADNAKLAMGYVEELYDAALKESDPDQIMEKLGEIFWWICQAKPWRFGDPSIAELLIRTVLDAKGLESPPWNVNLIPWVAVSLEPDVKKFAKNFKNLFEWTSPSIPTTGEKLL